MREFDAPRLVLMSHIRSLAKELREEEWEAHKKEFKASNRRQLDSGRTADPDRDIQTAERSAWHESHPLDGYFKKAVLELQRVSDSLD